MTPAVGYTSRRRTGLEAAALKTMRLPLVSK